MNDMKQEAYMEVRDELLQKKEFINDIHVNLHDGWGKPYHPQVQGIMDGLEYALVIVDNLMLQDRKS